ncbi:MAG TPA: lysylphosphatidylglycerol synthase transmembrane domain-containing protein [Bacteroidales bacterium]|nr:lysylphosphatidylglycerol synthase transmembrane domain-containing protein [Bacteroidales bacterium]HPI67914.1 lysylphosphatidylglycerol synthase transmembrane domain-containing protein [Bacteroidales bacterium]HPR72203.1 lysylphosphatidylglycerol synthase transmembrane domain-containing protein [Bacteroidales bacterium]
MKSKIIRVLKFIILFSIGILLLWLAFRSVDFSKLVEGLKKANYYWLLLSVFFGLIAYISRARRWQLLIRPLGYNTSFWQTFHALMVGYLANLALPRMGEITRCMALGKKEKLPVDQLIGTVIIERTIDLFSVIALLIILILTSGNLINEFLKTHFLTPFREKILSNFGSTWIIWGITALICIILLLLLIRYRKNLRKFKFIARIFDLIKGVINGLNTITRLDNKWEFIFHTVFIWLNYALMTWVVFFAVESTSDISFTDSFFILVVGGLAMSVPVQGGIGAFHYFVSRGLAVVHGVILEDGLIYALLAHESQILFELILGPISFYMLFGRKLFRKQTSSETR